MSTDVYAVNKATREHTKDLSRCDHGEWTFVHHDRDGWVELQELGATIPVPDNQLVAIKMANGDVQGVKSPILACNLRWDYRGNSGDIVEYKPFLDNPVPDEELMPFDTVKIKFDGDWFLGTYINHHNGGVVVAIKRDNGYEYRWFFSGDIEKVDDERMRLVRDVESLIDPDDTETSAINIIEFMEKNHG